MSDDPHRLSIRSSDQPDGVVLTLEGEIDPHTAPELQSELDDIVSAETPRVVLDLSAVRFIDSSGLRVFISAHRAMKDRGGELILRAPSDTTVRLLEVTGLDDHLEVEA